MRDLEKVMERLGLDEYVSVSEFNQLQSNADLRRMNNKKICKYLYRNSV